jgi:thiamine biosynthesis lipoprotein ApbE
MFAVLCSILLLPAVVPIRHRPAEHVIVERSRVSMGSEVHLTAWTDDETRALRAFERVFDEFDRLDRLHSVWKEGSDVLRVNAAAGRRQ